MTAPTPVVERAGAAIKETVCEGWPAYISDRMALRLATTALTAALDDPDLATRISTMRRPCGHSRLVNVRGELAGSGGTGFEDACSPCLRDRLRAYFLGEPDDRT